MASFHYLTKTRYMQGLQCPKLLWLSINEPELGAETDEATQHLFNVGKRVGEIAQKRYQDGVLIAEGHMHLQDAIHSTEAYAESGALAMFEATAKFETVLCRADILKRIKKEWEIHEVKMSTKVKDEHLDDLAIQRYCFDRAGYPINKTCLMHVNNKDVRTGGIDPMQFLIEEDMTEAVSKKMAYIETNVSDLSKVLTCEKCPVVKPGDQCRKPYDCPFFDHCNEPHKEYSIYELPRGQKLYPIFQKLGIELIRDIPEDFKLSERNRRIVQSNKTGKPVIDEKDIRDHLGTLEYPLYYFDFETINPAIPPYDNWRPYQTTPFQFSLHIQKNKGKECEHYEFLLKEAADPRRPLIESMLKLLGKKGSIIAWKKSFEIMVIKNMAEMFPEYKEQLLDLVPRFWDLITPFQSGDYVHYDFHGSASIKDVLPVLVPSLSYEKLEIQEGGTAGLKYELWLSGEMEEKEWQKTHKNLLEYCGLDTLAMVEIMRVLYCASSTF